MISINGRDFNDLSSISFNSISEVLHLQKSKLNDTIVYGNSDRTCIEIFIFEGHIDEITVKLDLRNITKKEVSAIIEFCLANNFLFLYKNKSFYPTIENLSSLIFKSSAKKFIDNPIGFFEQYRHFENQ